MQQPKALKALWAIIAIFLVILLAIGAESFRRHRRSATASRYSDLNLMELKGEPMTMDERVELRDLRKELGYNGAR